jgi:prepilin peptidase CpaA
MAIVGALIIFPVLMALAASSDLFTMTISNRISILLVVGFVVMAAAIRLPLNDVALHLSCGLAILVMTFTLFCLGWVGGGDAKLAAATALWLGWSQILDYGLVASILGGVLTLSLLAARHVPLPSWAHASWVLRLHDVKSGIPYGIALAAAGLLVYPSSQVWRAVAGS